MPWPVRALEKYVQGSNIISLKNICLYFYRIFAYFQRETRKLYLPAAKKLDFYGKITCFCKEEVALHRIEMDDSNDNKMVLIIQIKI